MSLLGNMNQNPGPTHGVQSSKRPWQLEEQNAPGSVDIESGATSDTTEDEKTIAREQEVGRIARQMSRQSEKDTTGDNNIVRHLSHQSTSYSTKEKLENPFLNVSEDSPLNPNGPNFSVRAWIKNCLAIQSRDPERYPTRSAGIAFRNLGVYGYASNTDYQKDVGNGLLSLQSAFSKKKKLQILQKFDGLVESGEMLVVLGRPGR